MVPPQTPPQKIIESTATSQNYQEGGNLLRLVKKKETKL